MKTAESALQYLIKNSETTSQAEPLPQLIFLHLNLSGMSGLNFLKEFEKLQESIRVQCKVVVLSNFIQANNVRKFSGNPNVSHFLEKPLTKEKLKAIN